MDRPNLELNTSIISKNLSQINTQNVTAYNSVLPQSEGFPNEVASALMKSTTKKETIYGSKSKGFENDSPKIGSLGSPKKISSLEKS